mgnify:CR=1 FL=1
MLDKDDIENGLFAPSDNMGDRERLLTTSLSNLRELTIMITNQLGSIVDPEKAVDVKAKKQKGTKDDMLSGQNVGDKSTLGNRSLPRHAGKPGKPITFNKPKNYLTKSKDFTGDVISKNGNRNPEREKPEGIVEEEDDDIENFGPLGLIADALDGKEKKSLDSNEVEMLTNLKQLLGPLKEISTMANALIGALDKKNRTTVASQSQVLTPESNKPQVGSAKPATTRDGKIPFNQGKGFRPPDERPSGTGNLTGRKR